MFCKSEYQKREGKILPFVRFLCARAQFTKLSKGDSRCEKGQYTARGAIERQKEGKKNQWVSGTLEDAARLHYFLLDNSKIVHIYIKKSKKMNELFIFLC